MGTVGLSLYPAETPANHCAGLSIIPVNPVCGKTLVIVDVGMVVTDYYMPQLNGLEFILRARQIWPTVPFIIITGHGVHFSPDDFAHVPELRTVLHKPFKWRALAEEIVRYWGDSDGPYLQADAIAL